MTLATGIELTVDSRLENIAQVRGFIAPLLANLPMSEKTRESIEFCLVEAAVNAMVHGNKTDPKKQVVIGAEALSDRLRISVRDEGDGFDPERLEDPTEQEKLSNPSGRGVYLISQMMSSMHYDFSGTGTTLHFEKLFS
jgi:serine/threonine-protein kinase RsbW